MKKLPIIELADPDGGRGCLHSGGGAHDAEKADEWEGFEAELAKKSLEKLPPSLRARVDWQAARQEPKRRAARFTVADRNQIKKMNRDGWSISAIALHFGAQRMVVAAVINQTGPYARQDR